MLKRAQSWSYLLSMDPDLASNMIPLHTFEIKMPLNLSYATSKTLCFLTLDIRPCCAPCSALALDKREFLDMSSFFDISHQTLLYYLVSSGSTRRLVFLISPLGQHLPEKPIYI